MNRIKLPGKDKYKKILLVVLVIISIGLLLHEYSIKNKNIQNQGENKENQKVEETIDIKS